MIPTSGARRAVLTAGIALAITASAALAQPQGVRVISDEGGERLQVDGRDFMVFGMNWDYSPIGTNYTYVLWNQPDDIIQAALALGVLNPTADYAWALDVTSPSDPQGSTSRWLPITVDKRISTVSSLIRPDRGGEGPTWERKAEKRNGGFCMREISPERSWREPC